MPCRALPFDDWQRLALPVGLARVRQCRRGNNRATQEQRTLLANDDLYLAGRRSAWHSRDGRRDTTRGSKDRDRQEYSGHWGSFRGDR